MTHVRTEENNRKGTFDWRIEGFRERKSVVKESPRFKVGKDVCYLKIYEVNKGCSVCVSKTAAYLVSSSFNIYNYTFYMCLIARCGKEVFQEKLCMQLGSSSFIMFLNLDLDSDKYDVLLEGTLTLRLSWCENQEPSVREIDTQTTPDLAPERESNPCLETLSSDFCRLYESKADTDCVLKVGKVEFPVHRQVLATRSEVFAAMFRHDTSECRSGVVDIPDVDGAVLDDVLHYIYSGQIRGLTSDTAVSMYVVADKYALFEMRDICLDLLKRSLTVQNICEAALLAHTHGEMDLENEIIVFIEDKLEELEETDEWQNFSQTKPSLANKLIRSAFMACKKKLSAK